MFGYFASNYMIDHNPYVQQVVEQTGATASEVRKSARKATITLDVAQSYGYNTVDEYLDAMHEFLNGC